MFNNFYVLSVSIKFVFNFLERSEEKETIWTQHLYAANTL